MEEDILSWVDFSKTEINDMCSAYFQRGNGSGVAAEVGELGAMPGAQTRNLRALMQVKEHAASATGRRP